MINIPETGQERVVIVGCGFGGLKLARKLRNSGYQVVIVDKRNYHQFQPLFYQVATAGLEPSAISFPLRKIFQHFRDFYIRIAEVTNIDPDKQQLWTTLGIIRYNYLVLTQGASNYFFGMKEIERISKPMKSVSEALDLRNTLLQNFESALAATTEEDQEGFLNIVVVGGGPTGVEVSGALADMRKYVLGKDYPEIKKEKIRIFLLEGMDRLLSALSEKSASKAREFLQRLGVEVMLQTQVKNFDGKFVETADGKMIRTNLVIWTAGISGARIPGLRDNTYGKGNRIRVDRENRVEGYPGIFALGDVALMAEPRFPNGHPQVAPVAIQQAKHLATNLKRMKAGKEMLPFSYKDKGTMATVGRNLAIVELPNARFYGTFAWLVWMFVHLMSIVGIRNRFLILVNWFWNYVTYDTSLRLIIKPKGC
jgi:NADH:ubiquinone reductase (H+-translocating)